ncbi:MAG: TonB-dependent receptor [Alphaproteobacteria bacterium]
MKLTHLMCGVAASALLAGVAFAQSTGTQEVEKVVVTGERGGKGGVIVKEQRPKTRSTVTDTYLDSQGAGQTVFQSINLLPGVSFTNSDPYGSSGGNVRVRGFDGARVSLTVDGIPLNDTGNYAIFTNQQVDPEYLSRVTVNTGTTDVDSPTASATGGTINVVTRKPYKDLTLSVNAAAGSFDYSRFIGIIDTGEYNGTSAFAGVSVQEYNKFKGPGSLEKTQGNARIYQEVGESSFISLIGHYNENRNNFYRNLSYADIAAFGYGFDNLASCTRDAANGVADINGVIDNVQNDGLSTLAGGTNNILNPGSCTNFFGLRINPSNTGNLRAQANLQLTDTLRLTVDPSWQYVKANGGGTTVLAETDRRLGGTGRDLNGDGDTLDQIRLYTPNNTNTSRYGVTASLIWQPVGEGTFRVAYTGDHGRHRQTGVWSQLDASGNPQNVFSALDQGNLTITGTDGNILRGRDRLSKAILNQISASYSNRLFDDKLLIDIGIRAPFFSRDLNQYCFSQVGSSNVICTREAFTDADGDGIGTLAGRGTTNFIAPLTRQFNYDALLPNIGISYEFEPSHIVYGSYAEGFSAPRTDNLYTFGLSTGTTTESAGIDTIRPLNVRPEKTQAFDLGYRYQGDSVTASAALWYNTFEDRIVSAFDPDLGISVDRNVGAVVLQGIDVEIGWRATEALFLYSSFSYNSSELQDDIRLGSTSFLPTKGKTLVETPDWTAAIRGTYDINQHVRAGLQGKYVGERFSTDVNDQIADSYVTVDADLQVDLALFGLDNMLLQLNGTNLLDEEYVGSISSQTNALTILDVDPTTPGNQSRSGSTPTYSVGAPQAFQIQLKTKF